MTAEKKTYPTSKAKLVLVFPVDHDEVLPSSQQAVNIMIGIVV